MEDDNQGITTELVTEILTNVKTLEGITDTAKDDLIKLYIDIICHNLIIRTNRRRFVEEMKYVVALLVKDAYDSNSSVNTAITQAVRSMSEYDRSVTFGTDSAIASKLNLIAQKQLDDNEVIINRFKLLYRV